MTGSGEGEVITTDLDLRSYKASTCRAMKANFFNMKVIPVGIDSCTSATVASIESMFIGKIEPVRGMRLHGVGGSIPIIGKGTLRILFTDDDGKRHEHRIEGAYYAPRLHLTLLSTRQWSKQGPSGPDGFPIRKVEFQGDTALMRFEDGRTKTIDIEDGETSIPILETSSGEHAFSTYLMSQHLSAQEARLRPTALTMEQLKLSPSALLQHREQLRIMRERREGVDDPFDLRGTTAPTLKNTFVDKFKEPQITDLEFDATWIQDWTATGEEAALPTLNETDKKTLMLRWHYRLGHMPFKDIKASAKAGLLDPRLATIQEFPFCPGCQFGKASKRQWRHRSKKKDGSRRKIRVAHAPGDVVSLDTMDSRNVPGLMPQLRGKPTLQRYHYATVFVDHFSDLGYVHLHQFNDDASVLEAKLAFERYAGTYNVRVKHFHCDNGVFADNSFKAACRAARQTCSYCGVNAHHQNGKAEKRIRDTRDSARSMLILAKHNWPAAITVNLWGFAMLYAAQIRNSTLREGDKRTALQKFAGAPEDETGPTANIFHTFGCPVYNLDPKLQSGGSLESKWSERARIGIFLGLSREHATSVSVVLNPDTGLTSPQFHVKHDERFETVNIPAMKNIGKWQGITQIHQKQRSTKSQGNKRRKVDEILEGIKAATEEEDIDPTETKRRRVDAPSQREPTQVSQSAEQTSQSAPSQREPTRVSQSAEQTSQSEEQQRIGHQQGEAESPLQREIEGPQNEAPRPQNEARRPQNEGMGSQNEVRFPSQRETRKSSSATVESPSQRERRVVLEPLKAEAKSESQLKALLTHHSHSQKRKRTRFEYEEGETANSLEEAARNLETMLHSYHSAVAKRIHAEELVEECMVSNPMAFAATLADEDTMYLNQAKKEPDWKEFHLAMQKEINDHNEGEHWEVIKRSEVPTGQSIMRGVWSMKRKRRVGTGEIYKWKARMCIDGSSQKKGVNYWDTYSPVVSWETIRSLLTLAIMNSWETRQIDFVLAFPQAEVECPMYMEVPKECHIEGGVEGEEYVLQLKKNLYGAKQAGKVWFEFLKEGLLDIGFEQSKTDKAVFFKGETIFVVYVDDGILMGPNSDEISNIVGQLSERYKLTDEGDLNEYLGIEMKRTKEGRELTQKALIRRILETVGIDPDNVVGRKVHTPARAVLQKDEGGLKRVRSWDYRSVVGMLNWLARSTRPELIFAVSQVGRFMAFPKRSHEEAIMRICQYLSHTQDKGMIMRPEAGKGFEVYADADFAGGYNKNNLEDPATAKSRTAYHIMFNNCLIYSHSKLQTEVALSTTEAEYICLSQALRTVTVLMRFFKELAKRIKSFKYMKPKFKCTAFEDNNGAIELATAEKQRPRTKHINIKYHHFKSAVSKGKVKIRKIDTKEQLADIGTKPLERGPFEVLRMMLIGW